MIEVVMNTKELHENLFSYFTTDMVKICEIDGEVRISPIMESVIQTKMLYENLFRLIPTEKVKFREVDGEIRLTPLKETIDYISKLRGILSEYSEMSVEEVLEGKDDDKGLNV